MFSRHELAAELPVVPLYSQLGPNTTPEDFEEAMFVRKRSFATLRNIIWFRGLQVKEKFKDGAWTEVVGDDNFTTVKKMSPTGKKMQAAIENSVKEAEAERIAEQRFTRPSEDDKDDFYRWANHKIRELNNCSKTSEAQLQYARDTMSAMFGKIDAEKELVFPEPSAECSLEMVGNYGFATPPKGRKRGHY